MGDWAARALAAALVTGVVGAVAWLMTRGAEPSAPRERLSVRVDLEPRSNLFGDAVRALVDVELDRRVVDPASVRVEARLRPYSVSGVEQELRRSGDVVALRRVYTLQCLAPLCVPAQGAPLQLALRPARVHYRLRSGAARTVRAEWPASYVLTRITGAVIPTGEDVRVPWPWRWPVVPPEPSFRAPPALAAAGLYGLAALLALLAAYLLAPLLRPLVRLAPRRRDPLAGLPPLERALALLERAVAAGRPAEQRKALDRLARELGRRGDDELAKAARRLAWSSPPPGAEVGALRGAVARALGGRP